LQKIIDSEQAIASSNQRCTLNFCVVCGAEAGYCAEMSAAELIAEIQALPDGERERVFRFLITDKELCEDLQDSILIESRRNEPSRPLADVLKDLGES